MAILANVQLRNGIEINGAYLRIEAIGGNKNNLIVSLVPYLKSNLNLPLEDGTNYQFVPDKDDESLRWDKQAYRNLKKLERFEDAIDVLEEGQKP